MRITSLQLKNYRNYNNADVTLGEGTNIFYGNNAQGKTNLLEAIYVCGTTKSHKGSKEKDFIQFEKEEAHIKMKIEKNNANYTIDMHLKKNKSKGIAINGIPIKKSAELFGMVYLVFFSPEDLNMIKNTPAERRKFLNFELCQLDKIYLYQLGNYKKILLQRNHLLKKINPYQETFEELLEVLDQQLIEYGKGIIYRRKKFIDQINPIVFHIHNDLSGGKEKLYLEYAPNVEIDEFRYQLDKNRKKDILYKMTSKGPHRDDIIFKINGIDVKKYGSQGQQRSCILSLKLAEIELVRKMICDDPILLLDDVLSELDRDRQNHLLKIINHIQTMITCTGLEEFVQQNFVANKIYRVKDGKVINEK